MQIKTVKSEDYLSIARLHKVYLNKSFLGTLGTKFLTILYKALDDFEKGFLLTAEDDGKIVGFISGTINTNEFYHYFIKRNFIRIVFALFPNIISFKVIRKVFETVKYSKKDSRAHMTESELLSMVVVENYQGRGVAEQLFKSLVFEFKNKGVKVFKIIAGNKLIKANKMYQKMGCVKIGEIEVHSGDSSSIYIYK